MAGVERFVGGPCASNGYVVSRGRDAAIVDGDGDVAPLMAHVEAERLRVRAIVATHGHHDHVAAATALARTYGAPFHVHPGDEALLRRASLYRVALTDDDAIQTPSSSVALDDGQRLRFGELAIDVLHTPGHTEGSVCLAVDDALLTGDTLLTAFHGPPDLPGSDPAQLAASIERLTDRYPPDTVIHPGHGEPAPLGEVAGRALVALGGAR